MAHTDASLQWRHVTNLTSVKSPDFRSSAVEGLRSLGMWRHATGRFQRRRRHKVTRDGYVTTKPFRVTNSVTNIGALP
jgi:hypothetical protein